MSFGKLVGNSVTSVAQYIGPKAKSSVNAKKVVEGLKYDAVQFSKTGENIGKHKVKRFLYHFTSKENYESMLKDGEIKKSDEMIPGVFMTDITNFFKRWNIKPQWDDFSLKSMLLQMASKGSENVVLLKIPTNSIDKSKLIVRSQEKCFKNFKEIKQVLNEKGLFFGDANSIPNDIKNKFPDLFKGVSAKNSSLLKKQKQSIEYIYPDNIKMSNVKKIGEINLSDAKFQSLDTQYPEREMFMELLKGQPESKGASLLKS